MLSLKTTMNPDALEIDRDGKTIGTLRRNGKAWDIWVPSGDGATIISADVIKLVVGFMDIEEERRRVK